MTKESTRNLIAPRDLLERALSSLKGIRVWFSSQADAVSMRNRMASVKTEDRKKSTKLYGPENPLYNRSAYDDLAIVLKPGELSVGEEIQYLLGLAPEEALAGVWMYILPEGQSDRGFIIEDL